MRKMEVKDAFLRKVNVAMAAIASVSVLLMMHDEETRWDFGPQYRYGLQNVAEHVSWAWTEAAIPLCNACLVALLVVYYAAKSRHEADVWAVGSPWTAFCFSSLLWKFVLECALCLLIPPSRGRCTSSSSLATAGCGS